MDAASRRVSAGAAGTEQRQDKRDTLKDLEYRFHEEERNGAYAEAGRYANEIAKSLLKQGALRKALKWLETDYKYTTRALEARPSRDAAAGGRHARSNSNGDEANGGLSRATERDLAVTLQCLGEVHLSLHNWNTALSYMHRHLELAKQLKDLAEEQRACTQLGRAYLDVFVLGTDRQIKLAAGTSIPAPGSPGAVPRSRANPEDMEPGRALVQAKDFLQQSLKLAKQMLSHGPGRSGPDAGIQFHRSGAGPRGGRGLSQHQPQPRGSNSLNAAALADSYLNMGVLFDETDDVQEALKCCALALQVCDDEEIEHIAEVRSRIHHNLGKLYMKQRDAERAKQHFTADITICNRLGLLEEEGKGWTSLGDLKFREEEYEDALRDFTRAHELAKEMVDESDLLQMCENNLAMVRAAQEQQSSRDKLWNQHRKVQRMLQRTKSAEERLKLMTEDKRVLKELMDLAESMDAWYTHLKAAEEYVAVAEGLGDVQTQCDAAELMATGSYNLCHYDVAAHWYQRSLGYCRDLKHIEFPLGARSLELTSSCRGVAQCVELLSHGIASDCDALDMRRVLLSLAQGESVALLGMGNVLDSKRQWKQALDKFYQALRVARSEGEHGHLATQMQCLENIHYSYLLRFHNINKANEVVLQMHSVKALLAEQQRRLDSQLPQQETPGMDDSEPAVGGGSPAELRSGAASTHSRTHQFAVRKARRAAAKRQQVPKGDDEETGGEQTPETKGAEQSAQARPTKPTKTQENSHVAHGENASGEAAQMPAPTQADVEDSQEDEAAGTSQGALQPLGARLRGSLYPGRTRQQDGAEGVEGVDTRAGEDVCVVPDSEDEGDEDSAESDLGLRAKRRRSAGAGAAGSGQGMQEQDGRAAPSTADSPGGRAIRKAARTSLAEGAWGQRSVQGAGEQSSADKEDDGEEESLATVVFSRRPSLRAKKVETAAAQGMSNSSLDRGKAGPGPTMPHSAAEPAPLRAAPPGKPAGHSSEGQLEKEPPAARPEAPVGLAGSNWRQAGRRTKVMLDSPDEDAEAEADLFLSCMDAPEPGSSTGELGSKQPNLGAETMDNAGATPATNATFPRGQAQGEQELKAGPAPGARQQEGPAAVNESKGLSPATPAAQPGRSAIAGLAGLGATLPGSGAYGTGAGSPLPPPFPQPQHEPQPMAAAPGTSPCAAAQIQPFVLVRILDDTLQVPLPQPEKDATTGASSAHTVQWLTQAISELYCSYHAKEDKGIPHIQRILCRGVTLAPHLPLHVALQVPRTGSSHNDAQEAGATVLQAVLGGWRPLTLAVRYRVRCVQSGVVPPSTLLELLQVLQSSASLEAQHVVEQHGLAAPACNLDDTQVEPLLAVLQHGPILSRISLPHNDLGTETVKALVETESAWDKVGRPTGAAPDLHLDLHSNAHLGPAALSTMLTSAPLLSRLRNLDLSGCLVTRVGPTGPEVLDQALGHLIGGAPRLDKLNLNNCGLGAASFESLAHALQEAASQEHLPNAPGTCSLTTLKLGGNAFEQCSDATMSKFFAAIASLRRLRCLDLSGLDLRHPPVAGAYGAFLAAVPASLRTLTIQHAHIANSTADQVMAGLLSKLEEPGSRGSGTDHPVAEQLSVPREHLDYLLGRPHMLCEEKGVTRPSLSTSPRAAAQIAEVLARLAEQLSLAKPDVDVPIGSHAGDKCPICTCQDGP